MLSPRIDPRALETARRVMRRLRVGLRRALVRLRLFGIVIAPFVAVVRRLAGDRRLVTLRLVVGLRLVELARRTTRRFGFARLVVRFRLVVVFRLVVRRLVRRFLGLISKISLIL